jgi:hypothetical protein
MSRSDFNWSDETGVLAYSYGCVAVHPNTRGDVVIRQKDDFDTDDQVVVVPLDTADRMADAIREAASHGRAIREELAEAAEAPAPEKQGAQARLALPPPAPNTRQQTKVKPVPHGA